jgi:ketosteroid isomerase-like protein
MQTHPNRDLVLNLFAAFERADLETVQASLADDAVWHFPGRRGALAGSHRGWDAILAFLLKVPTITNGTFQAEIIDVVANDQHAVVLFRGHAKRGSKELDNPTSLRIRIENSRITELWEFVWDLDHVEDFWDETV